MDIEALLQGLNLEANVIAISMAGLAIALVLFVNRKRLQMHLAEWRIQRCLNRIGSKQIRNLICADGLEGYYHIDRLALTRDAILLISYKPYGGNIYCAERISEWTQVIGQKSFKFENPLFELDNQLTALGLLVGSAAPLHRYLFFNHSALFPKGHPESILNSETVPERFLAENCEPINPDIQAAWNLLKTHQAEFSTAEQVSVKT